jgi:hypothetical protein
MEEEDCFQARIQFTFITQHDVCTPYCGLAVCVFSSCPSIEARWPSGLVRTYLVVREETECLCCFSCVRTPWSACVQTVVLTGTGFGKLNSESLQIHYTCLCLGRHLPVQHPGIGHSYVNQVIENTIFKSHLRNLPVLLLSKSTFWMWLLYTDTTVGHDISTWFFFFLLYRHICDLGSSPTNIEMRLTLLFVLKYNSRNIHRIKVSSIFLWKTHLASFSNYVQ